LYDLVINTRKIPAPLAAAMVVDSYQQLAAQDHD
jgi:hypothetical protein